MSEECLHIEIKKSFKKDCWCIRTGSIVGAIEYSNVSKKDLLEEVKDRVEQFEKGEY